MAKSRIYPQIFRFSILRHLSQAWNLRPNLPCFLRNRCWWAQRNYSSNPRKLEQSQRRITGTINWHNREILFFRYFETNKEKIMLDLENKRTSIFISQRKINTNMSIVKTLKKCLVWTKKLVGTLWNLLEQWISHIIMQGSVLKYWKKTKPKFNPKPLKSPYFLAI